MPTVGSTALPVWCQTKANFPYCSLPCQGVKFSGSRDIQANCHDPPALKASNYGPIPFPHDNIICINNIGTWLKCHLSKHDCSQLPSVLMQVMLFSASCLEKNKHFTQFTKSSSMKMLLTNTISDESYCIGTESDCKIISQNYVSRCWKR